MRSSANNATDMTATLADDEAVLTFVKPVALPDHPVGISTKSLEDLQREKHPNIPDDHFIFAYTDVDDELIGYPGADSAFASMAHQAFSQHIPVVLRPDDIHLLLIQGVARFIEHYPEDFRRTFVNFDGKQEVLVMAPNIGDKAAWREIPKAFADIVAQLIRVPALANLIMQGYSQSTQEDDIAKAITFMGTFSSYFTYTLASMCHIPQFILKGSVEDWQKIAALPLQMIAELNLQAKNPGENDNGLNFLHRWLSRLQPVLQNMSLARAGTVNAPFWKDFYKHDSTSGGDSVTGNIVFLYPFLKNSRRGGDDTQFRLNRYILGEEITLGYVAPEDPDEGPSLPEGPRASELPANFIKVDFQLKYGDKIYPMAMTAGIIATRTTLEPTRRIGTHVGFSMFFKEAMPPSAVNLRRAGTSEHTGKDSESNKIKCELVQKPEPVRKAEPPKEAYRPRSYRYAPEEEGDI